MLSALNTLIAVVFITMVYAWVNYIRARRGSDKQVSVMWRKIRNRCIMIIFLSIIAHSHLSANSPDTSFIEADSFVSNNLMHHYTQSEVR